MNKIVKRALIFLAILIVGIGLLNFQYFSKQVRYFFNKPDSSPQVINNQEKSEPNIVEIPSLGIKAPLVESSASNEDAYQEALQKGVVHFPGTALVGEVGNAYYFGHSSDFPLAPGDYKTVFALLPQIKNGAEILVSNGDGVRFKYIVYDQFVANNSDTHLLEQNTEGKKILTLQTSYPVGTALKRYIVKAELIE